jgi:arylsulfatase
MAGSLDVAGEILEFAEIRGPRTTLRRRHENVLAVNLLKIMLQSLHWLIREENFVLLFVGRRGNLFRMRFSHHFPPAPFRFQTAVQLLAVVLCIAGFAGQAHSAEPARPNILLILADDMGFSDAGCYGGEIQTPNLDRLAAGGVRFTQFYNTARCWPSRAAMLTGYYAQATRRDGLIGFKMEPGKVVTGGNGGVRQRWAQLLPAYLSTVGYRSYHSGKWHVDGQPLQNGFVHSYMQSNSMAHFSPVGQSEDGKPLPAVEDGKYFATTAVADYAIKYLKEHAAEHRDTPFLQYLAFHSPHFPVQASPEDIAIYKDRYTAGWDALREERLAKLRKLGITNCDLSPLDPAIIPSWNLAEEALRKRIGPGEVAHAVAWNTLNAEEKKFQASKMSVHAAMVHRMDIEIGRVLEQIKSMGALDNTIVLFMSDNGASAEQMIRGLGHDPAAPFASEKTHLCIGPGWSSAANTPFRLHKSWNHEGGISTPLIVCWPAGLKARGELRTDPAHLIDIVPTLLEITVAKLPAEVGGMPVPPLHGRSLLPTLAKDGSLKHEYLWWNHDGNRAIRMGDWKLVADHQMPWELYDLGKDRSEMHNLAAANPEKVKELEQAWTAHAAEFYAMALQDPQAPNPKKGKAAKKDVE